MRRCAFFVLLALAGVPSLAFAQPGAAPASSPSVYKVGRTAFGDPDLQGLWTNASITTLERPAGLNSLVLSPQVAGQIEARFAGRRAADQRATDPSLGAPATGDDVRGYNSFWIDLGSRLAVIAGEIRSSWIVDPSSGKVPYSMQGRQALRAAAQTSFDGPETRPIGERCIIGYGSTSGPPMLNVLYNNHYQIVQSPGHVVIVVEMNHDARIIRLGGERLPATQSQWLGDSIGRFEGDTLVVETTNLHPGQSFMADVRHYLYVPPTARIVERFTRVAADEILYEFSVSDDRAYTQTWRGEMPLRAAKGPMFEYACHEGNYSLTNILKGARHAERSR